MEIRATEATLYQDLPASVKRHSKELSIQTRMPPGKEYVTAFIKRHLPVDKQRDVDELEYSAQIIDSSKKSKFNLAPKKRKCLTVAERKGLELFDIKPEHQKYDLYIPMHALWKSYIHDVIHVDGLNENNVHDAQQRLLKADYHGCLLMVTRSKCPSYVGIKGIVLQETRNTLKIITKENKLKCIPKGVSVFTFNIAGYCFTIHGKHFRVKASERAVKKFKSRPTLDL